MPAPHEGSGVADPQLADLAAAHGVATSYRDSDDHERPVPESTVRAALQAIGVTCDTSDEVAASLRAAELAPWRETAPPAHVVRRDAPHGVPVSLPAHTRLTARLEERDSTDRVLADGVAPEAWGTGEPALIDGAPRRRGHVALPADLPLGEHTLWLEYEGAEAPAPTTVVVTPPAAPTPAGLDRRWGWMAQLYAVRSQGSWGHGDLADLRGLSAWTAERGGDFVVVNPLHASAPTLPVEDSPYSPSSRRFANPLYLRVDEAPEFARLGPDDRERVLELARRARRDNDTDRIDRDALLARQLAALEILAQRSHEADRAEALERLHAREGRALRDFATFCAIAERHGLPFTRWPAGLHHPDRPEVAVFRAAHAERVRFFAWLQLLCDEQLAAAHDAATAAGMGLGVVHDLAVGVDRGGADAWLLQDDLARGVSVGAPPDAFNQRGQDWQQPPFVPQRLRATGAAPVRDMLRSVLRHAGGIRIDHILGLFRLFWIPDGASPADGTYVRYPAEELLGVLALEAHRAGAVVVGEDLGTVPEGVRDALRDRHILSSSVLYFERDTGGARRAAEDYPAHALASVTTHDLPTAAGWWADAELRLRDELGLHGEGRDPGAERARKAREREGMATLLADDEAAVGDPPDEPRGLPADVRRRVLAMHAFLGRSSSRLVAASIHDAVGDLRQPNLPGTVDEYPNWRRPVATPERHATGVDPSEPTTLEALASHPFALRLTEVLAASRRTARGGQAHDRWYDVVLGGQPAGYVHVREEPGELATRAHFVIGGEEHDAVYRVLLRDGVPVWAREGEGPWHEVPDGAYPTSAFDLVLRARLERVRYLVESSGALRDAELHGEGDLTVEYVAGQRSRAFRRDGDEVTFIDWGGPESRLAASRAAALAGTPLVRS